MCCPFHIFPAPDAPGEVDGAVTSILEMDTPSDPEGTQDDREHGIDTAQNLNSQPVLEAATANGHIQAED